MERDLLRLVRQSAGGNLAIERKVAPVKRAALHGTRAAIDKQWNGNIMACFVLRV